MHDYVEDEHENEVTSSQLACILTGSPTAIMLPAGAKQHDVDYLLSRREPLNITDIKLTSGQLEMLSYFARDLKELEESAFVKEGPGSLQYCGNAPPILRTAATDEAI